MERLGAPFNWRERIGIFLALLAGLLLFLVALRINSVGRETGGDIGLLAHESQALIFLRDLHGVDRAFQDYRVAFALGDAKAMNADAKRSDTAVDTAASFAARYGSEYELMPQWNLAHSVWKTYRKNPGDDRAHVFSRRLGDVYDQLEEKSRLIYDPDISAQNLADTVFQETPALLNQVSHSAAIGIFSLRKQNMTMAQRLNLAILARGIAPTIKNTKDEINITIEQDGKERTAYAEPEIARLKSTLKQLAPVTRYADLVANGFTGSKVTITEIVQHRDAAVAAIKSIESTLSGALADNLNRRIALERTRTLLFELAILLGAILLAGVVLEIVHFVARRDREELRRVQEESARLSAELAREHAEKALALTEAQFRAVFDGAAIGIAILDHAGELVDANSVFRDHFGRDAKAFLEGHQEELALVLSGREKLFEFEQHYTPRNGDELWVDATVSVVSDENELPQFAMCMFRDITMVKRSEHRLVHDKTHDSLTGLPNRLLFESRLRERFSEAGTLLDSFFAVLVIDLDHFKDFNESLGHGAGDLVLQAVATRLRASLDPNDLVARLGSDEFAVLIRSLADILHVESVARRIINNVCKPIQIGERSVFAACSIGIAIGSATYERAEDLMRDAGTAMSQAKASGGARYAVFDSNMHARSERRLQLSTDLRLALQRNEFRLLYQPIVRISDGGLIGCEALLRWDHPTEGLILPGDFVALAEQTGIAIPIGKFVFETAIRQLAKWRRNWTTVELPVFSMSVNVSASEIFDADFEEFVVATCDNHGVDPREVTLEITESVVLDSNTRANLLFERLQKEGFKICIDDFGTGYSSLRYLQQFRIDQLKIDRSFVAAADGEVASEPIVRTLMTLAEAFDLRVVAEGVESQRQRDVLRQAGCRYAQGYYYSRAVSAAELAKMYPDVLARKDTPASA